MTAQLEVKQVTPGIRCKAGYRHTSFDGGVYVRTINGVDYWVEIVRCECLTVRTTKFVPGTGVKVGVRQYWRPKDADWPDDLTPEECTAIVLRSMLVNEENENHE